MPLRHPSRNKRSSGAQSLGVGEERNLRVVSLFEATGINIIN